MVTILQLTFRVKKVITGWLARGIKDWTSIENPFCRLKEEWFVDEDISESFDKIAVSDAHTHIERLVFPAVWCKNKNTGERCVVWNMDNIAGVHTMMIHGGDSSMVFPFGHYVDELYKINASDDEEDTIDPRDMDPKELEDYHKERAAENRFQDWKEREAGL